MTIDPDNPPVQSDLQRYYVGLHRVLKNFRFMTILGWTIVLVGVAGIPLGWEFGRWHGLIDLMLCCGTIIAGLALVQQSVVSLDAYIKLPFWSSSHENGAATDSAAADEIKQLLKDVDEGGWQDAYSAIRKLRDIGAAHGLPPLE